MSKNLFITGTDTDVGKTYISGLIVKKLIEIGKNAAYYKVASSGNQRRSDQSIVPGDATHVKSISNTKQTLESMCSYVYENAVSPHLASRLEGNPVSMSNVRKKFLNVCRQYDYVTMEGSGGITCPICFDEERIFIDDIVRELKLCSIIVANSFIGTINQVKLTYEYMKLKGLPVKGIIMNNFHPGDYMEEDNRFMCEYMTGLKVIACVQNGDTSLDISANDLLSLYEE